MKTSPKKAFSDPQHLLLTSQLVGLLSVKFHRSTLQVGQRLEELRTLFSNDKFFLGADHSLAESPHGQVQVLDHQFDAGLDFLLTWALWQQSQTALTSQLCYVAICEQPLPLDALKALHQEWPNLGSLSLQLQTQYPVAIKGFHQLDFGNVKLILIQASPDEALAQLQGPFDVVLNGKKPQQSTVYQPPWQRPLSGVSCRSKVAVIGAGISGVSTAYSLSKRGFEVTLIEQGPTLASGASGNRQGMLYAKLPDNATIAGQFYQQGLQHSMGLLQRSLSPDFWQSCGLLQLANNPKQVAQMQGVMKRQYPPSWLQWLSQPQAEQLAQQPVCAGGLYFPNSGWVSPAHWCDALYTQSGAYLWLNTRVLALQRTQSQNWQLELKGDRSGYYGFDAVVIANANGAKSLLSEHCVALKSIRGQVSYVESPQSPALVVCGEGYVTPSQNHMFAVGASYNLHTAGAELSEQDHMGNLGRLSEVLPQHKELGLNAIKGGRVGFRAVTPDYLPMVGQLADESLGLSRFAKLRQDANYKFTHDMPYVEGLYINAGHGSKGLISAPLSAEILASSMANQSLPVAQCVAWALDPNRFFIRDLIRRKR
ncbi:MAG: FAD-dependent 5-carboxymethylaminomethyl-2-thiouridine(34) oxidoreductase MnmC [Gammaproteobacteria bacterium]|nr:FAD-dependent 5-carboxymethylaminomethyl-2-thiouridine(34) oxidoreductase MnmC [Gammaproteobacteria bacterium]